MEYIDDKIQDLLTKLPSECSCIDYKVVPYDRYKDHEFIRDVIAMLNSEEGLNKEKFIVFGVTNERKLRGIDTTEWRDDNEWQHLLDNKDRIEVERFFSLEKRCNGAGLIMTRLDKSTLASIALSVLVTNLFSVPIATNFLFYFMDDGENYGFFHLMQYDDAA